MSSPIQNPRIATLLQEAMNLVGRIPLAADHSVVPVTIVDDLSVAGFRPKTGRAVSRFFQNLVAAEYATFRLESPPKTLIEVVSVMAWSSVASHLKVFFGSSVAAPANLAQKAFVDGRMRLEQRQPAGVLSYGTQAAALATIHAWHPLFAASNTPVPVSWVIGSRRDQFDFIEFQHADVNVAVNVGIEWIEIPVP